MMNAYLGVRMESLEQIKKLEENARAKKWKNKNDLIRALADNVKLIPNNPLKS